MRLDRVTEAMYDMSRKMLDITQQLDPAAIDPQTAAALAAHTEQKVKNVLNRATQR